MIKYDNLWQTLDELGISKNQLVNDLGISKGQMTRLNQNQVIKSSTIDELCNKLKITPDKILTYTYEKVKMEKI